MKAHLTHGNSITENYQPDMVDAINGAWLEVNRLIYLHKIRKAAKFELGGVPIRHREFIITDKGVRMEVPKGTLDVNLIPIRPKLSQ